MWVLFISLYVIGVQCVELFQGVILFLGCSLRYSWDSLRCSGLDRFLQLKAAKDVSVSSDLIITLVRHV